LAVLPQGYAQQCFGPKRRCHPAGGRLPGDAYNMSIAFDDGQTVEVLRRERPWLMLDADG
jgi:hypothetical protein